MGEIKDLSHSEGIKKLKLLAEDIDICMFCTRSKEHIFETRPMSTQEVDAEGNFWFFTDDTSDKNREIETDNDVQLIYSKISDSHYLTVYGTATFSKDQAKIDKLWNKMIEAWFKEGKSDPRISLIKFTPKDAYYWDTKNGKMITLLKVAISAVTGADMDGSVEGQIKL